MTGTFANTAAIVAGGLLGVFLRRGIPEAVKETVMQGLGLSVLLIGIQMSLKTENVLLVVISLVAGGAAGQAIDIEKRLAALGARLETRIGGGEGRMSRAFVTASLIYCVGAMAIVGSIEDGLNGNPSILLAKATLDGVSAVVFSSTLGPGVIFSALPVFLYQGSITLLADNFKTLLTDGVVKELTATGGLMIVGIAVNILGIREIRVGNLLPALPAVVLLALAAQRLGLAF
ncbi:MAG: DUF554 domain-containing protein [Peptococcaceae bacterium]|nr:DUF554 domain-containing protein [Peptococcaceae bacterium]